MSADSQDIEALLQSQAALIDELRARVARLEASGPAPVVAVPARLSSTEVRSTDDDATVETSSRRGFLRLAGAAAAGAAVAVVANAAPAAALDGGTYSGSETVFNNNGIDVNKAGVKGTFGPNPNGIGVLGQADVGSAAAGVFGAAISGYGVYGSAGTGYALYAGSNGRLGFDPHLTSTGAPTSGAYKLGDIVMNTAGDTFSCVVAGSGGAAKFRKLAGPKTAGQYHPIAPTRIYDSRPSVGGPGPIVNGENRFLTANNNNPSLVGVTSTAITINVTLAETTGFGLLSMWAVGDPQPGASLMNWTTSNAIIANGTTLKVGPNNQFVVHCEGIATQFLIDMMGYWT